MSIPISFLKELHNFCVRYEINEMTFSLKEDKDTQNHTYQYTNIDDMECLFGRGGSIPTNFIFELSILGRLRGEISNGGSNSYFLLILKRYEKN